MYFIDMLYMYQNYDANSLPHVGEELISRYSLDTGEKTRETVNPKNIDGSYSTKFRVRCDGTRVSVEANPSKWNRMDNLFGFQTIDECVQLYNIELLKLGLPSFTKTTKVSYRQIKNSDKFERICDGAMIRRIDITRNLSVGFNNEYALLRGFASQRIGKSILPLLRPDQATLEWSASSWYHKLYIKAVEMLLPTHRKYIKKLSKNDVVYRNRIVDYCNNVGLVRDEKEFKQRFLNSNDLCFYGLISEKDFLPYLKDIDNIIQKIEISTMDYEHISDQLLDLKICTNRQSANSTQSFAFAWLYGQSLKKTSSYFVHQKRLRELGIDIGIKYDSTKLMPQLRNQRDITVSTLLPPDWYQMPVVNNIRLVA